jgi:DNA-binding NarL/FixJ family response regulator
VIQPNGPTAHAPESSIPLVRVLLVDDQRLLREGLRTLLELHPDLAVVGEAGNGLDAELLAEELRPQVILMDLRMPRRDGVEATRRITTRWPELQVLVLTTYDDDELVFQAIEAGASGYLLKDVGSDTLAEAIRAASRGESPLQPSVARKILRRLRSTSAVTGALAPPAETDLPGEPLTGREIEVLGLLGTGATNREIAEKLSLTEGTVKNYISTVLAKTGLHDRTQAALYALRHGAGPSRTGQPPP